MSSCHPSARAQVRREYHLRRDIVRSHLSVVATVRCQYPPQHPSPINSRLAAEHLVVVHGAGYVFFYRPLHGEITRQKVSILVRLLVHHCLCRQNQQCFFRSHSTSDIAHQRIGRARDEENNGITPCQLELLAVQRFIVVSLVGPIVGPISEVLVVDLSWTCTYHGLCY